MAIKTEPFLGLTYNETVGAQDWNTWTDANIVLISVFSNLAVDAITSTSPGSILDGLWTLDGSVSLNGLGSIVNGRRVIVGAEASGVFAGKENQIAVIVEGVYLFFVPPTGTTAYVRDQNKWFCYEDGAWTDSDDFGSL